MLVSWASLNGMPLSRGGLGWCTGASERVATTTGLACAFGAGFGSGLDSVLCAAIGHIGLGLNNTALSREPGSETLASAKVAGCAVAASSFQWAGKRNPTTS